MNGQTLAHVRRILTGSDRALIHAVNDAGHEHKLEVPADAVRGVEPGRDFVLMVSWSLLALPPRAAEPATTPTGAAADPPPVSAVSTPTSTSTPANAVDAEFMALMARTRRSTPEPATPSPAAPGATGPEHQIAALLGLAPTRST